MCAELYLNSYMCRHESEIHISIAYSTLCTPHSSSLEQLEGAWIVYNDLIMWMITVDTFMLQVLF